MQANVSYVVSWSDVSSSLGDAMALLAVLTAWLLLVCVTLLPQTVVTAFVLEYLCGKDEALHPGHNIKIDRVRASLA